MLTKIFRAGLSLQSLHCMTPLGGTSLLTGTASVVAVQHVTSTARVRVAHRSPVLQRTCLAVRRADCKELYKRSTKQHAIVLYIQLGEGLFVCMCVCERERERRRERTSDNELSRRITCPEWTWWTCVCVCSSYPVSVHPCACRRWVFNSELQTRGERAR